MRIEASIATTESSQQKKFSGSVSAAPRFLTVHRLDSRPESKNPVKIGEKNPAARITYPD
jgi:hypothetical protein